MDKRIDSNDVEEQLPAEVIVRALRQATPAQWASERGRRNAAARKTITGGRNGGRPKKNDKKS